LSSVYYFSTFDLEGLPSGPIIHVIPFSVILVRCGIVFQLSANYEISKKFRRLLAELQIYASFSKSFLRQFSQNPLAHNLYFRMFFLQNFRKIEKKIR